MKAGIYNGKNFLRVRYEIGNFFSDHLYEERADEVGNEENKHICFPLEGSNYSKGTGY